VVTVLASGDLGRPIIAPPGVPAERVKILREAFAKTVKDPAFLDDIKKKKLEADPVGGEELQVMAKDIVSQPPEIVDRMKKILGQ
jgi:tripartite-type tricarboxylate transporter receptor subunit TctC